MPIGFCRSGRANRTRRHFRACLRLAARRPPSADPNRVIYLAFTSGMTGSPKGVMHSDNTLLATVRPLVRDWALDARSVVYTLSPLSHNLGIGALIAALFAGAELVIHALPKG